MTVKFRKNAVLLLGLVISAVFLWLALRDSDLIEIRNAVLRANWWFAPLIVITLGVYFGFKTLRWKQLLSPIANVRIASLYPVVIVGYAANLILPAQMGELVRTFLAGQKYRIPASPVLITVILERMFDFLAILIFIGVLLPVTENTPPELVLAGYVCGGIGFVMLVAVVTHMLWPRVFTRVMEVLTGALPHSLGQKAMHQFEIATSGLESLRQPRRFVAISVNSLVQWLLMGLCTYLAIVASGIDVPVSAAFIVLAVVVIGMTIPSSPGFFGTIQLCFAIGLAPFGIDAGSAVAASVYFHGILFVSVALGGLFFARFMGYTPKGLVSASEARLGVTESVPANPVANQSGR